MNRRTATVAILAGFCLAAPLCAPAQGAASARSRDRYFITSDGVRLHYLLAGEHNLHTIVLVPGWTMPAWIFERQIAAFSRQYRVVAFDPRGQGDSQIAASGYDQNRRGQDIADLITTIGGPPVLLVGWSLGVLDALAYVHVHGDNSLAGLVLVDNSVGENPPPTPSRVPYHPGPRLSREAMMRNFVRSMFARPQPASYLDRLTRAALRTPQHAADALLSYPVPRTYWKDAIYSTKKPILYIVRPHFAGQAANLAAHHTDAETVVVQNLGHAMFVDDAPRFDGMVQDFIRRHVWR
jgi:non-heme chloroperoxidase